jgi:hypothetical protein
MNELIIERSSGMVIVSLGAIRQNEKIYAIKFSNGEIKELPGKLAYYDSDFRRALLTQETDQTFLLNKTNGLANYLVMQFTEEGKVYSKGKETVILDTIQDAQWHHVSTINVYLPFNLAKAIENISLQIPHFLLSYYFYSTSLFPQHLFGLRDGNYHAVLTEYFYVFDDVSSTKIAVRKRKDTVY